MSAVPNRAASRKIEYRWLDGLTRGPGCYLEMGAPEAPPLVFLHGFGGDLLTWQYCLVAFANRFRVLALDLPGHGRSTLDVGRGTLDEMVAWVEEALDALEVETGHFVGHSMGGKIALALTLARPERVRSLSLVSPAGLGGPFDLELLHRFTDCSTPAAALEIAGRLVGSDAPALLGSIARSLVAPPDRAARQEAYGRLLGHAAAIGHSLGTDGPTGDQVPWTRVNRPLQVIWGEADTVLPLPDPARLPPGAPFTALAGVGHLPQIEAPGRLIPLLDRFLP